VLPGRDHLIALDPYSPGRSAEQIAEAWGIDEPVELASNESPHPPLPSVIAAVAAAAAKANRYPKEDAPELRAELGRRLEVPGNWLTVGCGSLDLLQGALLATVGEGDEVVSGRPSFPEYERITRMLGGDPVLVPLLDGAYDLGAVAAAVTSRTRAVVVCTPNNPTGGIIRPEALDRLMAVLDERVLVILDEAYREFVVGREVPDSAALVRNHPNLLVLRTFSKAYGLAGLRVGYGFAQPSLLQLLAKTRLVFSCSRLAQAAALASLAPEAQAELTARVAGVTEERTRLVAGLTTKGFAPTESHGNSVWWPTPGDGQRIATWFEQRGVIVRATGPDSVRVTVGTRDEDDRFLALLEELPTSA